VEQNETRFNKVEQDGTRWIKYGQVQTRSNKIKQDQQDGTRRIKKKNMEQYETRLFLDETGRN
jgi:hypothetical protein